MEITITKKSRYKGLKGKFWDVFSDFIRLRDFLKYGTCVACGKKVSSYKELQGGHYAPAGNCGFYLLFHEDNVSGECSGCNGFDSGHLVWYRENLIRRIGMERYQHIIDEYDASRFKGKTTKAWNDREYAIKIEEYKAKIKELCGNAIDI